MLYNRQIKVSRLKSLENKFKKEPEFCQKYQQTIESYLKNGCATKSYTKLYNENKEIVNYIPHHGVNEKGLNYLSKLISILIKFRKEKLAVMGDIKEMYHQIFVSPNGGVTRNDLCDTICMTLFGFCMIRLI